VSGYSETPLAGKLGIKENYRVAVINAPLNFQATLGRLPMGARIVRRLGPSLDLILFFAEGRSALKKSFAKLAARLKPEGMLWVAWPKKSSGVVTDLSFEAVQETGLEAGMVDTKVCAVNEVWSALRFVLRLQDRPHTSKGDQ
jgi:hypothetical protein